MFLIEGINSVNLPVNRKLSWSLLLCDELVDGFCSILYAVELRDQPARQVIPPFCIFRVVFSYSSRPLDCRTSGEVDHQFDHQFSEDRRRNAKDGEISLDPTVLTMQGIAPDFIGF